MTITASQPRSPLHYAYHQVNPRRPLDWLWQRAVKLVASGQAPDSQWDTPVVQAAHALLAAREHGDCEPAACSDIVQAEQIHWSDNLFKAELQARILAHRSVEETAAATSLPAPVVFAYEQLFFHVLDRIDKHRFIVDYAVDKPAVLDPADASTIWKLIGYAMGRHILDDVLRDFRELGVSDYRYVADNSVPRTTRSSLGRAIDRSILALCIPWTRSGFQALQRMAFAAAQLEHVQAAHAAATAASEFWELAGELLDDAFEELAREAVQEYWAKAA